MFPFFTAKPLDTSLAQKKHAANLLRGSDFICFLFMNYWWNFHREKWTKLHWFRVLAISSVGATKHFCTIRQLRSLFTAGTWPLSACLISKLNLKTLTLSKNHAAPKPVLSCPILILLSRPRYVPHETEKESFLQKKRRHGIPGRNVHKGWCPSYGRKSKMRSYV